MDNSGTSGADLEGTESSSKAPTDAYSLPCALDLTAARGLRDVVMARLTGGAVILDAAEVERMSTPCIQVLLAAGHAAGSAHVPFRIVNASEVFCTAVDDLGLKSQFSNWMV